MLNLTASVPIRQKIKLCTEDEEAKNFFAALNRTIKLPVHYIKGTLGSDTYVSIIEQNLEIMLSKEILILLDGDAKINKIKNKEANILKLPGKASPERVLAEFLSSLSDIDPCWNKIASGYSKAVCFRDVTYKDIMKNRVLAKNWFQQQKALYPKWLGTIVSTWIKANPEAFDQFKKQLINYYNNVFLPEVWK